MTVSLPEPRLVIADGDPQTRRTLGRALEREGFAPLLAGDGQTAVRLAGQPGADALLVAADVPGLDGPSVCRSLREGGNRAAVILLSRVDDPNARVAGLEAGADDYLVIPISLPELVARLRGLLRRTTPPHAPNGLQIGDLYLDPDGHTALCGGRLLELTPTEFRLLELFMRNPDRVLGTSDIRAHLWGGPPVGASDPLPVHLSSLRRKLDPDGLTRHIHTVRGNGYVLLGS